MQAQLHAIEVEGAAIAGGEAVAETGFAGALEFQAARQAGGGPAAGHEVEHVQPLSTVAVQLQPSFALDAKGEGIGQFAPDLRRGFEPQPQHIDEGEQAEGGCGCGPCGGG